MKKKFNFGMLLVVVPFILGCIGFSQVYGNNLSAIAYSALRLYGLDVAVEEGDMNSWIEIARWLAAAVTVSAVLQILMRFVTEFRTRMKLRAPDAIVVHGDGLRKEMVSNNLGGSVIEMSSQKCFAASKHVLAFDTDAAAVRYLRENHSSLLGKDASAGPGAPGKSVYFCSEEYEPSDYEQTGVIVSNTAVNCARRYWNENWIGADVPQKDRVIEKYRIAIIGFGKFGQRILEQALLVNVSARVKQVEYHVFGSDGVEYRNWHYMLDQFLAINRNDENMDSLRFYETLSTQSVGILNGMDRVIITMDEAEENVLCLDRLIAAGIGGEFHVRCNQSLLERFQYLPAEKNITCTIGAFGEDSQLYTADVIIHGKLNEEAQKAHVSYIGNSKASKISQRYESCGKRGCPKISQVQNGDARNELCGECPFAMCTWDDLSPFVKASNIALADHAPVKRHMVSAYENGRIGKEDQIAMYAAEHRRWCRFHYLRNWQWGENETGGRFHRCLVPFEELDAGDKAYCELEYKKLFAEMNVSAEAVRYDDRA